MVVCGFICVKTMVEAAAVKFTRVITDTEIIEVAPVSKIIGVTSVMVLAVLVFVPTRLPR